MMTSSVEMDRVLVVDDDEDIRRLAKLVLEREYRVFLAADGQEALAAAIDHAPHVIILDLGLPSLNGREVCRELRRWYEGAIMILSAHGQESDVIELLDIGADDYLTKPFRPGELQARLRALLRRNASRQSPEAVINLGPFEIDLPQRKVRKEGEEIVLTKTEFDIFAFLVQNRDRVLTWKMILNQVWGPIHADYTQTLRVHIGHLRKKLEPDPSDPKYILTEAGVGFRFATPDEQRASASRAH